MDGYYPERKSQMVGGILGAMQDRQSELKFNSDCPKTRFCLSLPRALFGKENHKDLPMVL